MEYRQVARLCGFEPRTPDHLPSQREPSLVGAAAIGPTTNGGDTGLKVVVRKEDTCPGFTHDKATEVTTTRDGRKA